MVPFVTGSVIRISHIITGSHVKLYERTLVVSVTASFVFHSAVYGSYKNIKGTSKAVPLHVMKAYGGSGGTVPRTANLSAK